MWAYILKRVLLMVPTLLGVLLLTFVVIQFVPGGPVEQVMSQLSNRTSGGERAGPDASYRGRQGVDPAQVEELKKFYQDCIIYRYAEFVPEEPREKDSKEKEPKKVNENEKKIQKQTILSEK